jgi:hypothetical protein
LNDLPITPETKVAQLLKHYPELEETLIAMAPAFKKLRNPVLRRSVARVASLRQAAAVGGVELQSMIDDLRCAAHQEPLRLDAGDQDRDAAKSYFGHKPHWFDASTISATVDERELPADTMPLNPVMRAASRLESGQMVELVTDFLPAPGIDLIKRKGYAVWSVRRGELIHTFVSRDGAP